MNKLPRNFLLILLLVFVTALLISNGCSTDPPKLAGFVTDSVTGKPLNDASVSLDNQSTITHYEPIYGEGFYAFQDKELEEGAYTLTITKDGYVPYSATVDVNKDETQKDVQLTPLASIHGKITDSYSGGPVAGAEINVDSATGISANDGNYEISGIESGEKTMTVSREDFKTYTGTVTFNAGDRIERNVILTPLLLYVSIFDNNEVAVIRVRDNHIVKRIKIGNSPTGIRLSPDGTHVYVINQGLNTVTVIETENHTVVGDIDVGDSPASLTFTPDGEFCYVVNKNSNDVTVIRTSNRTVAATVDVGAGPWAATCNSDGTKVYVTNQVDETVSVINTADNTVSGTITVGKAPTYVLASPDGERVYVTNLAENTISVINTADDTVTDTIATGNSPAGMAVSSDSATLYVANWGDNTISVFQTSDFTETAEVVVGFGPWYCVLSPAGDKLFVTNQSDESVSIINTADNSVSGKITLDNMPWEAAITP